MNSQDEDKEKYEGKYEENVFINYPLEYRELFRTIVFAILSNDFYAICATKTIGSGSRFEKICELIDKCKYSIHDLSMVEKDVNTDLPRFNMAFELGLLMGRKNYDVHNKDFLVFDKTNKQTKDTLSDMNYNDSVAHNKNYYDALRKVNTWLRQIKNTNQPGNAFMVQKFKKFEEIFSDLCREKGVDDKNPEIIDEIILLGRFVRLVKENKI